MSEISEPVVTDDNQAATAAPQLSHGRILWIMVVVLLIAVAVSLVYAPWNFTFGLIFGGVLAFINYYWLKRSLKNIFAEITRSGERPRFLALRYFARYAALGACLSIVYLTNLISIVAVLLGLSVIAAAVVIEGFIRIILFISSKREEK